RLRRDGGGRADQRRGARRLPGQRERARARRVPALRRRRGGRLMFEVRGVTAGYGDTIVLRDVTVAVPDGSVVVLSGPNGAGKTTLLRVASGLLAPRAGSVYVDGL